jgi:hypothetical protein
VETVLINFSDFVYNGDIMFNMTENINMSPDADNKCCEACICADAHKSKPAN